MFKLARAEDEVARGDLVAEGLADLRDTEGDFDAAGIDDVFVISENALRGFGAEVGGGGVVSEGAHLGLKHQLELARLGQRAGFTRRRGGDELVFLRFGLGVFFQFDRSELALLGHLTLHFSGCFFGDLLLVDALDYGDVADGFAVYIDGGEEELIGAVAELRLFTVDHGIGKAIDVAGSFPDLWVHDDSGVEALHIVAALHEVAPPSLLDIVTQFDTEGAVVVKAIVAAVNFGGLKNETAAFAQADDIFHQSITRCWSCHKAQNDGLCRYGVKYTVLIIILILLHLEMNGEIRIMSRIKTKRGRDSNPWQYPDNHFPDTQLSNAIAKAAEVLIFAQMSETTTSPEQLKWHQRTLLAVLALLMQLWGRTFRFRWGDDVRAMMEGETPPAVVIFWHNRLFAATIFYLRYFRKRRLATLISASKDGAWLSEFVQKLGMRPVRGSRYNRGAQAVRDLIKANRDGWDIGVSPDGSRGPLYDMKPGALKVALKTSTPILLLSLNHGGAWRLKSWDRFYVPHPFSKIEVRMDVVAPEVIAGLEANEAAPILKERMDAITED